MSKELLEKRVEHLITKITIAECSIVTRNIDDVEKLVQATMCGLLNMVDNKTNSSVQYTGNKGYMPTNPWSVKV